MPKGKQAGERCVHLTDDQRCALFGQPERPQFCIDLRPQPDMCGTSAAEAMAILQRWERDTRP
jgi:hypothetical protein